ncbi:M57 family metalloprotease [Chitinophaga agri]|uniref:Protease n=1 Tax=Chitinophaga agri TaxID=2703787 RepID=A0A6B9ZG94_9BACT|nr:M57 family metalloprotease [Chitinophaga agri]QHS60115.1 protease [Chitinophaga agri]
MRKHVFIALCCLAASTFIFSCKKEAVKDAPVATEISDDVKAKIYAAGFGTDNVRKVAGGYLVENDIVLTDENLNVKVNSPFLRVANDEQYRTFNTVNTFGGVRNITVLVSGLSTAFITGTDEAIARYNAEGLNITFSRITSGTADITIQGFYQGPSGGFITLGSAGFPTAAGNPYNSILMNTHPQAYGTNPNVLYIASVIQHEIGHCIGFRHTDYATRSSCGQNVNEGQVTNGVGAVQIPGTPAGADPNSWMLACSNGGNRTFNANDIIALTYLY